MVESGYNSTYLIQSVGYASFRMSLGDVLHMEDIIYVLGLKKNLLLVSVLEDKSLQVIFMENQAYLWSKNQNIGTATFIGVREGGIYKLLGKYI